MRGSRRAGNDLSMAAISAPQADHERRAGLFEASRPVTCLLDFDPDLGADVDPGELAAASMATRAAVLHVAKGPWDPPDAARPALGYLILDGLLAREVRVGNRKSLELLGAGDLVQPWREEHESLLACDIRWEALTRVSVAVLDARFCRVLRPWPQVHAALLGRALRRARWQAMQAAINAHPTVEERLLLLFCHLGERMGRVTSAGVVLDLPLSHRLLSHVVRSLRPSVTTALLRLRDDGRLIREDGHRWRITPSGLELAAELCERELVEAT